MFSLNSPCLLDATPGLTARGRGLWSFASRSYSLSALLQAQGGFTRPCRNLQLVIETYDTSVSHQVGMDQSETYPLQLRNLRRISQQRDPGLLMNTSAHPFCQLMPYFPSSQIRYISLHPSWGSTEGAATSEGRASL